MVYRAYCQSRRQFQVPAVMPVSAYMSVVLDQVGHMPHNVDLLGADLR